MLGDSTGAALAELTTALGRAITFKRNHYAEAVATIAHEDEAASLLWNALLNTGVPTLTCWRRYRTAGTLPIFRGYLAPFAENAEEAARLNLVFRSPFGRLLGDGPDRGRFTGPSVSYAATDAGTIASGLLATTNADSPTGLVAGTVAPTVTRTRAYQFANVGQAIVGLSNVLDGFDFEEEFVDDGANLAQFNVHASLGSIQAGARFEYGPDTLNNVRSVSRTTQPPINVVTVIGANGLYVTVTDAASIARYGKWPLQVSASDVTELATLTAKAQALLRPSPVRTVEFAPEFGLPSCPVPFDDFNVGDTVPFYARRDALAEDVSVRLNGLRVVVDEDGSETAEIEDPSTPDAEATIRAGMSVEVVS